MTYSDITSTDSGRTNRRRVGRGNGSGMGKTCGRGQKGEGSRTGGKNKPDFRFDGGQFPLWQRLPKRGFTNVRFRAGAQTVPLDRVLQRISVDDIGPEQLAEAGLANTNERVKVVSPMNVERKITLRVHRVSASVKAAIEAAGGTVIILDG